MKFAVGRTDAWAAEAGHLLQAMLHHFPPHSCCETQLPSLNRPALPQYM
jgi:hypothetical protein